VCGSRNASVCWASSTTIAWRPSGVKFMLYGLATGIFGPARRPVLGLIDVRLLPISTCRRIAPV
jgi:hypothetical protein